MEDSFEMTNKEKINSPQSFNNCLKFQVEGPCSGDMNSYGSDTQNQSEKYDVMHMLGNIQKMSNLVSFNVQEAQERGEIPIIDQNEE